MFVYNSSLDLHAIFLSSVVFIVSYDHKGGIYHFISFIITMMAITKIDILLISGCRGSRNIGDARYHPIVSRGYIPERKRPIRRQHY